MCASYDRTESPARLPPGRGFSFDGNAVASWFETHGLAALLTMRVLDLILRSIAKRCVSKDEATRLEVIEVQDMCRKGKTAAARERRRRIG